MGTNLHSGSAVRTAEFIVSSARLTELYECSVVLRHTRTRAEEIVHEARALAEEAELYGDIERAVVLRDHLEQARGKYCQVLSAYLLICRKINEERQEIMYAQMELDREPGLSGVA